MARIGIAAILDEGGPFAIGDGAIGDGMGVKQRGMPRPLAIEGEAIAGVTDLDHAAALLDPPRRAGHRHRRLAIGRPDRGLDRIFAEQVKNIGQQQFLMLLFVMAAELDQRQCLGRQIGQGIEQRGIDIGAIGLHFVERRPSHHAAPVARVAMALGFVIAVEQERKAFVVKPVARRMIAQHEGFEKPRRMRQMPFRRGGVLHRLHRRIGIAQGGDQRDRKIAHIGKAGGERQRRAIGGWLGSHRDPLVVAEGRPPVASSRLRGAAR